MMSITDAFRLQTQASSGFLHEHQKNINQHHSPTAKIKTNDHTNLSAQCFPFSKSDSRNFHLRNPGLTKLLLKTALFFCSKERPLVKLIFIHAYFRWRKKIKLIMKLNPSEVVPRKLKKKIQKKSKKL